MNHVSEKKRKKDSKRSSKENGTLVKKTRVTKSSDELTLDKFPFSPTIQSLLERKGITSLFPIQAQTFHLVLQGVDVVARAKTGSGKTLAFVLPVVEWLISNPVSNQRGRSPSVLCLAPTRELAKQVCSEFEFICQASKSRCFCIYGSSPYFNQERALADGIDVLVGTPGRIKDHLIRGTLEFANLKFQILDECDQMLQMGFVDDVEFILNAVTSRDSIQTLLFSATLPSWVKTLLHRFCKTGYKTVDLMASEGGRLSTNLVQHKCLMIDRRMMVETLVDLIHYHGNGGRTIVFVNTKVECDRISEKLSDSINSRPIHGDLQQKSRELTLEAFRRGQVQVLVATDVAARGLDIPEVELVIQTSPPKDVESYIHRAGRTGRAEKTGVCICLIHQFNEYQFKRIQETAKLEFTWIQAPQVKDIVNIASRKAEQDLKEVKFHTSEMFKDVANQMLAEWKDPAQLVAAALAFLTGHSKLQSRSLVLKLEHHVTLQLLLNAPKNQPIRIENVMRIVQANVQDAQIKGIRIMSEQNGAVFDIHEGKAKELMEKLNADPEIRIEVIGSLPPLRLVPNGGGRTQQSSFFNRRGSTSHNGRRFQNSFRASNRAYYST
eukprot:g281.t1